MHDLAGEREQVAKLLVKTLEMIEHETGIFLIKPIMSIPSRFVSLTFHSFCIYIYIYIHICIYIYFEHLCVAMPQIKFEYKIGYFLRQIY